MISIVRGLTKQYEHPSSYLGVTTQSKTAPCSGVDLVIGL